MKVQIEDLTLVIMAHDNPNYLARSVDYYSRLECKKIIADSSSEPNFKIDNVPIGYDYRHLPIKFTPKMQQVASTLETPFVIVAGCDDLLVPEALASVTDFLRQNSDYVAAAGQHIGFARAGDGYKYFLKHAQEYLSLVGRGGTENVYARLNSVLTPMYGYMYSVMRSSVYKELMSTDYISSKLVYGTFVDRYVPLFLSVLGNLAVRPEFFLARSVVPNPVERDFSRMHVKEVMTQWPEGAIDEYTKMVISIAYQLREQCDASLDVCISIVDGVVRRTLPRQATWSRDELGVLSEVGQFADQIDYDLSLDQKLKVLRRDRFGMPFVEAEHLFPVYRASESLAYIASCLSKYPIEIYAEN